jgi:hypothetical protein
VVTAVSMDDLGAHGGRGEGGDGSDTKGHTRARVPGYLDGDGTLH